MSHYEKKGTGKSRIGWTREQFCILHRPTAGLPMPKRFAQCACLHKRLFGGEHDWFWMPPKLVLVLEWIWSTMNCILVAWLPILVSILIFYSRLTPVMFVLVTSFETKRWKLCQNFTTDKMKVTVAPTINGLLDECHCQLIDVTGVVDLIVEGGAWSTTDLQVERGGNRPIDFWVPHWFLGGFAEGTNEIVQEEGQENQWKWECGQRRYGGGFSLCG